VVLERLINRDAHPLEEALEILRTNHDVGLSEAGLRDIWRQLPLRLRTTEVGEEAAELLLSNDSSESVIDDHDHRENINRLQGALATAFAQIAEQDRVLIALRFDQDLSMVEIAGLTGSSVPTLHRRLDKSVKQLRSALSHAGFDPREVANLIGHPSIALSPLLRAEVERFLGPVRLSNRDG
jgi:hypothetical protein